MDKKLAELMYEVEMLKAMTNAYAKCYLTDSRAEDWKTDNLADAMFFAIKELADRVAEDVVKLEGDIKVGEALKTVREATGR